MAGFNKCYTLEYQVFRVSHKLHVNSSSISWPIMPCCQWVSFVFVSNWALSWCLRDCTKNPTVTSLTFMLKQFPLCPNKVLRSSEISTSRYNSADWDEAISKPIVLSDVSILTLPVLHNWNVILYCCEPDCFSGHIIIHFMFLESLLSGYWWKVFWFSPFPEMCVYQCTVALKT